MRPSTNRLSLLAPLRKRVNPIFKRMRSQAVVSIRGGLLALVALSALLGSGCATPERLAKRILTPPNVQQQRPFAQRGGEWIKAMSGGTNRFETLTVSVVHNANLSFWI